jgi:putative transposase
MGFLNGMPAIRIVTDCLQVKRNYTDRHFWTRGYCVGTAGLSEVFIRKYTKNLVWEK